MKEFLMRWLPASVIVYAARKMEKLTPKETEVQTKYKDTLRFRKRNTEKPVVVAMVGLVGSGKNTAAQYLAELIGATVVCGDDIRIELRKQGLGYDKARLIGENIAASIISQRRNVILDSDFVDRNKRESIRQIVKKSKPAFRGISPVGQLIFIRTVCDLDVMFRRIRENDAGEFFNSASTKSTAKDHGKDVKLREMWRRTPQHYDWENADGGRLTLKKMNFLSFAPVDMSADHWRTNVESIALYIIHENKAGS